MRVLVTGATGFVGRHVVTALLDAGHEVSGISRTPDLARSNVDWIQCDLLDKQDFSPLVREARADALLHCAWSVDPHSFWSDPANLDWVGASLRLMRGAQSCGIRRICAVGTCFEYRFPPSGPCLESLTKIESHTLYDTAKDACRRVMQKYADQSGLSFAWARLFYLYGPGERAGRLVSDMCRALLSGEPALATSGRAVRDYMDVRDAAFALAALVTSDLTGPVNVGSGVATRISEIVTTLGELAGRPDLVRLGARPDRPDEPPCIVADVRRLTEELRMAPARGLHEGLSDSFGYWRAELARPAGRLWREGL